MEDECLKHIKDAIQQEHLNFDGVVKYVENKCRANYESCEFKTSPSDISFIKLHFRYILMDLWESEIKNKIDKKRQLNRLKDSDIIKLLEIFQKLNGFDETPIDYRGPIFKQIRDDKKHFMLHDFINPRTEICNELVNIIKKSNQGTPEDFNLFENLIEVLKKSYELFDDLVKKLELEDFANEKKSLFKLSQNILKNNFAIENYDELVKSAESIQDDKKVIHHIFQREIRMYLMKTRTEIIKTEDKEIFLIQRKILTSKDLEAHFGSDIEEIHIISNTLHINKHLPPKYYGKNVLVMTETIWLHEQATWNLSGRNENKTNTENAGQHLNGDGMTGMHGEPGDSGGNCEIITKKIRNSELWTITSNGGNGSKGQNGGNGADGVDGYNISEDDFKLCGEKISNINFLKLLEKYGISTAIGSRRFNIYDNNLQKQIIFNRDDTKSELLMLIKGSSGTTGAIGGCPGVGGQGGYPGKIKVHCEDLGYKIINNEGSDGSDGKYGSNGIQGRDGTDAYMKISSHENITIYGGLNTNSKYELTLTNTESNFSIFYKPFSIFFDIIENQNSSNIPESANTSDHEQRTIKCAQDEENFFKILSFAIKNANKNLLKLIEIFKIRDFIDQKLNFKEFATAVSESDYIDIFDYDVIKSYANLFTNRPSRLENKTRDFLRDFIYKPEIQPSENVYGIRSKILSSEDINAITMDFDQLIVVCDTLHINSSLSEKFRGRCLSIYANTMFIYKSVTFDLSGISNFLQSKYQHPEKKLFENGGHCRIKVNKIYNSALLKIVSNGGHATTAQNGIDVQKKDFMINGKSVEDLPSPIKKIFKEEGLEKHLVKNSNINYLLLVKGTYGFPGFKGLNENGGLPGYVVIDDGERSVQTEIEVFCELGKSDISRDGRDAFVIAINGMKQYIGLNEYNRYDLVSSSNNREYSVEYSGRFYYPKFSRSLTDQNGLDTVGLSLYEHIIWFMRNSYEKFDELTKQLKLDDFISYKNSLADVAEKIKLDGSDIFDTKEIANSYDMINCAKSLKNVQHEVLIREGIKLYFNPADLESSSNIFTVRKKVCLSSELFSLEFSSKITEMHLICDQLHVDSDLPNIFRGKNFAIIANYVHVHKNIMWDLSGEEVVGGFDSNAGQDSDGTGRNGADGIAGNSGGNFLLHCKMIENSSAWTFKSNGSDGTDGQDGGDGIDGISGVDAVESSFNNAINQFQLLQLLSPIIVLILLGTVGAGLILAPAFAAATAILPLLYKDTPTNESKVTLDNGLKVHLIYRHQMKIFFESIFVIYGSSGEAGKPGGLPGYRGQGGYPGKFEIISTDALNNVQKFNNIQGADGKSGKAGYNGIKGCDGKDMWQYKSSFNSSSTTHGLDERNKYALIWREEKTLESVYDPEKKMYATVICEGSPDITPVRERNESTEKKEKSFQILAKKCNSINVDSIIQESSTFLNSLKLTIKKTIFTSFRDNQMKSLKSTTAAFINESKNVLQIYSYKINIEKELAMVKQPTRKVSKKKSDILKENFVQEYIDYYSSTNIEVVNLAEQYNNIEVVMEETETQVHADISVPLAFHLKTKQIVENKANNYQLFYSNVMNMLLNGCQAVDLFEILRESRFSAEAYKCLIENICQQPQIEKSNRKFVDNKTVLEECVAKISENMNVENFIKYVAKNYPLLLENYFKNSIQNSQFDVEDVQKICKEKLVLIFFQTIYLDVVGNNIDQLPMLSTLSNDSTYNQKGLSFRKVNDVLAPGLLTLQRFLKECGDCEKTGIIEYFEININNVNSSFPESIFQLINSFESSLPKEIHDVWRNFYDKAINALNDYELDYNISDYEVIDIADYRKDNYLSVVSEFFSNDTVIECIKNDIRSRGAKSILFKRILAHKFNIRLSIYKKNFDAQYDIIEMHNYDDILEIKYGNQQKISTCSSLPDTQKEILILQELDKFSIIENDTAKLEAHMHNQKLGSAFEIVVETVIDENVGKNNRTDIHKYIDAIFKKFSINDNKKMVQIFIDDDFLVDDDTLIDMIVSSFQYTVSKIENDCKTDIRVDESNVETFKNYVSNDSNLRYTIHDDQLVRDDIRHGLKLILDKFGTVMIKAFAIRLFVDKNTQFFGDFSCILECILNKPINHKYFLVFMILGNEQYLLSFELALLELESIHGVYENNLKTTWRKKAAQTKFKQSFPLFLEKVLQPGDENDQLNKANLDQIIDNMEFFEADTYNNLKNLKIFSWRLITTERYWRHNLEKLKLKSSDDVIDDLVEIFEKLMNKYGTKVKDLMNILQSKQNELQNIDLVNILADFNTDNFTLSDEVLEELAKIPMMEWKSKLEDIFSAGGVIRNVAKIVKLIKNDQETSKKIKSQITDTGAQATDVFKNMKNSVNGKRIIDFTRDDIQNWIQQTKSSKIKPPIVESLAIIVRMFQFEINLTLRDTQLMSILVMWNNEKGVLTQVSTGEGKTFIGVSFAILKVLYEQKIDIITSSSVLAVRDAKENKKFFNFFGISVDHNCHESTEKRKQAYRCQVVYGVLGNFQRDYLLTEFYNENFMSGHNFENVLVDEVDSMLLDKGNNILYLSSNIPDIDELGSVFMFIWQYVNRCFGDPKIAEYYLQTNVARINILNGIYGYLDESILENIIKNIDGSQIMERLRNSNIIDEHGLICHKSYYEANFSSALTGINEDISNKIKFLCREKIETEKQIRIPKYLKKFVLLHLDSWIESAKSATVLKNKNEYIVDRINDGRNISKDPKIIIVDLDTGTDMINSKWDKGLHQFLELKHGCRISPISLKSVFISNVTFFKKYNKLYGMTGTLGNIEERNKTTAIHNIDFATIPRYVERKFKEHRSILEDNLSLWIQKIQEECIKLFEENRSVLIICETIEVTDEIKQFLLKNPLIFNNENIHVYQREIEQFAVETLKPKHVIVATNLASRGTDIKLSDDLKQAGGLHVILTYLPQNARIEDQAFGRASRAGDMGSGRLVMYINSTDTNDISKIKETRYHNELQRLDEVNSFYQNFITIEEGFFEKFHFAFRELSQAGSNQLNEKHSRKFITDNFLNNYKGFLEARNTQAIKIYLENFKLAWSFWLDEKSKELEKCSMKKVDIKTIKENLHENFQKFLSNAPILHPVKCIELFKYFNESDLDKAKAALVNDFQPDLIAQQYYKCYESIKRIQRKKAHISRTLTSEEKSELIKCLKILNQRISTRDSWTQIMNSIKKQRNLHENMMEIKSFDDQQKELNKVEEIMVESIEAILGRAITPDDLVTDEMKHSHMTEYLYEKFLQYDVIKMPRILKFSDDEIRYLARDFNIRLKDLKEILKNSKKIKSLKNFEEQLQNSLKIPSRMEFWATLKSKEILVDEVEYAIIDLDLLKNIDPSLYNEIGTHFKSESLSVYSHAEIYFSPLILNNENEGQFIILLEKLKSQVSTERFNLLMDNNIIEINRRAKFCIQKYNELKNEKIFDLFDEIKTEDFEDICPNYEELVAKLITVDENNIKLLDERENSFALNFQNINRIESDPFCNIFGDDEVYKNAVLNLIKIKFQNRIALEVLANKIEENIKEGKNSIDEVINLHIKPHSEILCELFNRHIIDHAKVANKKLKNFKNVKSSLEEVNLGVAPDESVFTDHETKEFLNDIYKNTVVNFDGLKKRLKQLIEALANDDIEIGDVVLVPLKKYVKNDEHNEAIGFMQLKGFDMVMKVELKTYSSTYWWRFTIAIIIALVQIVAGALLAYYSGGFLLRVGITLIHEGIRDVIYSLQTLKTNRFSWKDYREFKTKNLVSNLIYLIGFKLVKVDTLVNKSISQFINQLSFIYRYFSKEAIEKTGNIITVVALKIASDPYVINFLKNVKNEIFKYIKDKFGNDFTSHDVSTTIESLLQYYNPDALQNMILDIIDRNDKIWADAAEEISCTISKSIHKYGSSNLSTLVTPVISNGVREFSTLGLSYNLYDNINKELLRILDEKNENDMRENWSNENLKRTKQKIFKAVEQKINEKFNFAFDSIVTNPTVEETAKNTASEKVNQLYESSKQQQNAPITLISNEVHRLENYSPRFRST